MFSLQYLLLGGKGVEPIELAKVNTLYAVNSVMDYLCATRFAAYPTTPKAWRQFKYRVLIPQAYLTDCDGILARVRTLQKDI